MNQVIIFHYPDGQEQVEQEFTVSIGYDKGIISSLERNGINYSVAIESGKIHFHLDETPMVNVDLASILMFATLEAERVLEELNQTEEFPDGNDDDDAYEYDQDPSEGLPEDDMFYSSGQGKLFDRE